MILTLGVEQDVNINIRFGVPFLPETSVKVFISILWLIMSYGYIKSKKWALILMLIYSIIIAVISTNLAFLYQDKLYIGNVIFSIIMILDTFSELLKLKFIDTKRF